MSRKLHIVMYHYVRDIKESRYPEIRGLEVGQFEEQIQYIKDNFNVICMEDMVEAIQNKSELPDKSILLTFDDGYIDHYNYAFPILMKYNLKGAFFVPAKVLVERCLLDVNKIHYLLSCGKIPDIVKDIKDILDKLYHSGVIEVTADDLYTQYAVANRYDDKDTIFAKRILQNGVKEDLRNSISSQLFEKYVDVSENILSRELYMDYAQLAVMKRNGMHIGIHGYDHYWLGKSDFKLVERDITKAKKELQQFLDEEKWVMNYPYGSYNEEVINIVKSKGGLAGLSTEVRVADLDSDNIYALPRFDTNDFPPKSLNYLEYR